MGFSKKSQTESESEPKKWVIAGISLRSLKPINTKAARGKENDGGGGDDNNDGGDDACSTTPTAKEARIQQEKLPCPPAPRKPRPSRRHNNNFNGVREFFTPPDLETVFKRRVEKAN